MVRVRRRPRLRLLVADTLGPEALADPAGRLPVADDGREAVAPAADGDLGHDTFQIRSLAAPYPPTHNDVHRPSLSTPILDMNDGQGKSIRAAV